jgi:type VI protein secretion system component VasA
MNGQNTTQMPRARLATVDELLRTLIPAYLSPIPSKKSVTQMLKAARVQSFKSNPTAKRGGGRVFYSVSGTEKLLRHRSGMQGVGEVAR